ncbi:hypothetical protein ABZ260_49755 [Streptosporangium sp. NPDC006013]|uniref:hypothetical protein n=1 Tax=Streptosporangium sp. NPDC006013 TaxID=3155596 RepID=UPI0033A8ED47
MSAAAPSPRSRFKISIFLSYPKPCNSRQEAFVEALCGYLDDRGFAPRTLGVTDYDMDAPLKAIRRLMLESNALITIAFRRTYVERAVGNHLADLPGRSPYVISDQWLTSPWSHIEPAMAFQLGLPSLILRERGVIADGILEKGILGSYMPEFDTSTPVDDYFDSPEWRDLIWKWESQTRKVVETKGNPPKLY